MSCGECERERESEQKRREREWSTRCGRVGVALMNGKRCVRWRRVVLSVFFRILYASRIVNE